MKSNVTVKLASPIVLHDKPIGELIFRSPRFAEYMQLGEPVTEALTSQRIYLRTENHEIVGEYARALLVTPDNPHVLNLVADMRDLRAIKAAILGFFAEEPKDGPETLSSGSDGTPPPSAA